jgi:predicted GIY-YIG superfamily endonuclease
VAEPETRLRMAPVAVDGTVPFRPSHSFDLPRTGGVYLIHDLRGCLYIGRSDNLRERFDIHQEHSHNRRLRYALRHPVGRIDFAWILVRGEEQKELERRLIRELDPLCNDVRYQHHG